MSPWLLSSLRARLQYKQQDTPAEFTVDEMRLAFWIDNDPNSDSLRLVPHSDIKGQSISPQEITLFDDTMNPATNAGMKDIRGWYQGACRKAQEDWSTLESTVRQRAQMKLNKEKCYQDKSGGVSGFTAAEGIWTMRGFFIGPDHTHAPPYVTVLCYDTEISQRLVRAIQSILSSQIYRVWGVTRLPKVEVLMYGPNSDNFKSSDEEESNNRDQGVRAEEEFDNRDQGVRVAEEFDDRDVRVIVHRRPEGWAEVDTEADRDLDKIEVRLTQDHSFPTMANDNLLSWADQKHRAGIRLEVSRDADGVAKGTVGGLVKVGERLYGLTVSHVFFSSNSVTADQQALLNTQDRLPTSAIGESGNTDNQETLAVLNRWQDYGSIDRDFDWALIDIPGLRQLDTDPELWTDVNLVRTVAGDFRPVAVAADKPYHLTQIVLATPDSTHCLRGVYIGSEALMGMPDSEIIHNPWVLRMERPWLIRSGDSGSWAFNAHTGELLGILVGGCPELLEAYILPAQQTFDSIEKHLGGPVKLPNCQPIDRKTSVELARTADAYREITSRIEGITGLEDLDDVENQVSGWIEKNREVLREPARLSYTLSRPKTTWTSSLDALYSRTLLSYPSYAPYSSHDIPLWTLQKRYNHISEKLLGQKDDSTKRIPYGLLSDLMLHHSTGSRSSGGVLANNTSRYSFGPEFLFLPDGHERERVRVLAMSRLVIENEVLLMSHEHAHLSPVSRSPWDRRTLNSIINEMEDGIANKIGRHKRNHRWSSLPESKASKLKNDCPAMLTTLLVHDTSQNCLVVVPPRSFGPIGSSDPVNWRSPSRLPFKLGNKSPGAAEIMQRELMEELSLNGRDYASIRKLFLKTNCSHIYLKEHGRMIEMAVYKMALQPGRKLEDLRLTDLPEEWSWGKVEKKDFSDMASPFGWLLEMVEKKK